MYFLVMGYWMGLHFHDWIDYNGVAFFERGARIWFTSTLFWDFGVENNKNL